MAGIVQNILEMNDAKLLYLNELTELLSNSFPIKFIGYLRIYRNGRAFAFSNNMKWQRHFLTHINKNSRTFEQATAHVLNHKNTYQYIWPDSLEDTTLNALHHYDIWNGMSVYRQQKEYVDSWTFAGGVCDRQLYRLYLEHPYLFERFITYCEERYDLLFDVKKSLLFHFTKMRHPPHVINNAYSHASIKKFVQESPMFHSLAPELCLTKREQHVLELLPFGMTAKEIAQVLKISHRTVESYLQKLKIKMDCFRKSDLIKKALENKYDRQYKWY